MLINCTSVVIGPNIKVQTWSMVESVSDIIERRVGVVHDLGASTRLVTTLSGSNDLPSLLLLSSGSMLAHRFLLDFELTEKHIALVLLNLHLLLHVIVIFVEFAHSPVWSVVISSLLRWATTKLLVHIWVHLIVTLSVLVLG